jgi:AbrB family looped-hinge helix DNA binding protein
VISLPEVRTPYFRKEISMPRAKVTSKGQITIPRAIRRALNVRAGDSLDFDVSHSGDVVVRAVLGDVRDLKGLLHKQGRKAVALEEMNAAIERHVTRFQ